MSRENTFSTQIIAWQQLYGRHDLPWQSHPTPYRVWVSEIMLQQTQVSTVIPYYLRFMQAFPSLKQLAHAKLDELLSLWTGLGYYARARNLYKAAGILYEAHHSRFPRSIEGLCLLPGIGRSTAGAILSLSTMNIHAPILDGNVKRVLTRYTAFPGIVTEAKSHKALWEMIESLLPAKETQAFNQGLMDLGSSICTRTKPMCNECPLQNSCQASLTQTQTQYPVRSKKKKQLPKKAIEWFIYLDESGRVWLEKRPSNGIWGGLWSFPEAACLPNLPTDSLPTFTHVFTHFKLKITPNIIMLGPHSHKAMDDLQGVWYSLSSIHPPGGLPAPVKKILPYVKQHFLQKTQ